MDWSMIFDLIDTRLFIVVACCWTVGYILKRTPAIPDWTIIYLVTLTSIVLAVWLLGWGPDSIIQGLLAGAFAVYGHQAYKQVKAASGQ